MKFGKVFQVSMTHTSYKTRTWLSDEVMLVLLLQLASSSYPQAETVDQYRPTIIWLVVATACSNPCALSMTSDADRNELSLYVGLWKLFVWKLVKETE